MQADDIGFIGTGVMGASMAKNLSNAGYRLRVFNRTRGRAEPLLQAGAIWCEAPASVAASSTTVITMVGTPADVEGLYLSGDGLIANARPGTILVDMTSSDPELAQRLAAAGREHSVDVLDAPVSGGDIGARNATLSIMVGGDEAVFRRTLPLFERMGKTIVHQGPAGAGQYTKLCNQVAIAATMLSVCESMTLATAAGLDPSRVLDSITSGAAASWCLSELMPRALRGNFDPGFAVAHFTKDLAIALRSAERLGLDLPGLSLAKRLYDELLAGGAGHKGTHVLFQRYQQALRSPKPST